MGGHFSASIGGAQYQAERIVNTLVKLKDYDIYYLCRKTNPEFAPNGYKIIKIKTNNRLSKHTFIFDTQPLLKILNSIKPDIIYQRGLKAYTAIGAYYAKKNGSQFFFHIAHDYDVTPSSSFTDSWKSVIYFIEKKIATYGIYNATGVIAQTEQQARLLAKNYNRSAALVFPNLVSEPQEIISKDGKAIQVIWIANFKKVKQPEVFVELAEHFSNQSNVKFLMIGRSGNTKEFDTLHERIKRLSNLSYLGELPLEAVNEHLAKSHIFVNTSKAEGYPNTFLQAWIRNVPTVSLHVDIDNLLKDEKLGILCNEFPLLVKAVQKLVGDESLRAEIGETAQKFVRKNNSENNIHRLIELFQN